MMNRLEAEAQQAAEPVAMRYRFHYPDDESQPYRTSDWKYTQGPWDKIPGNAKDVSALSLHAAPTQHPLTAADVRRAGGIVHSDGNVFFTNFDMLNKAITGSKEGGAA